jgi:Holliday junction resolvase
MHSQITGNVWERVGTSEEFREINAMGLMSRNKGKSGEREIACLLADLTGFDVRRRVRQHDGDSDLEGIQGWSIEVKRHAKAPRDSIRAWWAQAVAQALRTGCTPVLLFRQDRDDWRAVWPVSLGMAVPKPDAWLDYEWCAEGSPQAWAAVVREFTQGLISGEGT